jgi:hypothetical protein
MRTINAILARLDGFGRCKPSLRFTHTKPKNRSIDILFSTSIFMVLIAKPIHIGGGIDLTHSSHARKD